MAKAIEEVGDTIYTFAADCEELFSQVHAQLKAKIPAITNLFQEYQHRFVSWTAYLGIFADKSVCLDRRLRRYPEVQDIIVRLLDVVYSSLQQGTFTASIINVDRQHTDMIWQ